MLEFKVDRERNQIMANGTTEEIMTDLCLVINSLYSAMAGRDKLLASLFRKGITRLVCDPDSALWDTNASCGTGLVISVPRKQERGTHDD